MYSEITINCPENLIEIVQSELINIGIEGIWEENNTLKCYIRNKEIKNEEIDFVLSKYNINTNYQIKSVENKNWNAEWESSYNSVKINDDCIIRATFHTPTNTKYEIVITPKMSFGTGHHSTTYLMAQSLFEIKPENMDVMDMGCGTGILAILSEKLGARKITAIDNEDWAVENSLENIKNNNCKRISVFKRESNFEGKFDLILSNITKNINLQLIEKYHEALKSGGIMLLSGFYISDVIDFEKKSNELKLEILNTKSKDNWACIYLKKC
ncbi:MAG: 50S ribosomal protein L11 methyltransferase [Bacteroidia bacterium]|nr:50S ribosomal protein L11 methyltransferase [Bacteroidia bacterium]